MTGDGRGDQRVQRLGLGAVDLGDQFAAVDDLGHGLADGLGPHAGGIGVEDQVADLQTRQVEGLASRVTGDEAGTVGVV